MDLFRDFDIGQRCMYLNMLKILLNTNVIDGDGHKVSHREYMDTFYPDSIYTLKTRRNSSTLLIDLTSLILVSFKDMEILNRIKSLNANILSIIVYVRCFTSEVRYVKHSVSEYRLKEILNEISSIYVNVEECLCDIAIRREDLLENKLLGNLIVGLNISKESILSTLIDRMQDKLNTCHIGYVSFRIIYDAVKEYEKVHFKYLKCEIESLIYVWQLRNEIVDESLDVDKFINGMKQIQLLYKNKLHYTIYKMYENIFNDVLNYLREILNDDDILLFLM